MTRTTDSEDTEPTSPSETSERSVKAMDGLVIPQPSAMHHSADSEFTGRCAPGDSNITLWQFLLELLRDGGYPHLIQWTNREGEFKFVNSEGVAQLWGKRKGKEHMNYDKLSRALRYYYDKNIVKKVNGQKFVYRFVGNPDAEQWNGPKPTAPSQQPEPLSYLQQYARATINSGMKNMMTASAHIGQEVKSEDHMMYVPTSTSLAMTSHLNTSDLASLNVSGVSTASNETPSPTDSSCSPNSTCSSLAVPTSAASPLCSSRPGSAHSEDGGCVSRKRKASPPPPLRMDKDSQQPPAARRRPENLNLASATQYLNPTLPMAISPMHVISQMSPFLFNQQMQLYALASASICPNSPLFSGTGISPLSTPKMPQVFQFPPVSASATVASSLASLMSPALLSAGFTGGAGSIFKFPANDILKTPTIPSLAKTPVPVANSDS